MTIEEITTQDWRSKAAISIEEAAELLGLGRNSAYNAVKRKEIPSRRIGGRILVPVAALRALLGEEVATW